MKIQTFKILKQWTITEKRSPYKGTHDSGIVNIPEDEFTPEQIQAWIDDGTFELVSEKEAEEVASGATAGTEHRMDADVGHISAAGSEAK